MSTSWCAIAGVGFQLNPACPLLSSFCTFKDRCKIRLTMWWSQILWYHSLKSANYICCIVSSMWKAGIFFPLGIMCLYRMCCENRDFPWCYFWTLICWQETYQKKLNVSYVIWDDRWFSAKLSCLIPVLWLCCLISLHLLTRLWQWRDFWATGIHKQLFSWKVNCGQTFYWHLPWKGWVLLP